MTDSALVKLYEKAKTSQWNASDQLDWSIDVDLEKVATESAAGNNRGSEKTRKDTGRNVIFWDPTLAL